jgi:hypothetical protein
MEKNLKHFTFCYLPMLLKSQVLPILKVELAGFWKALGLNNIP